MHWRETNYGQISFRVMFESLIPESEPFSNVIDSWSVLLNHEERLKSKDSPKRLLCTTEVLPDEMFVGKVSLDKNLKLFTKNFCANMKANAELEVLKKVELVFFPLVKHQHYYVLCFDLKNGASHILDNSATNVPDSAKYGDVPKTVQKLFMKYLEKIGDGRFKKFTRIVPKREAMKWRTKENHKDCAIFMMIHMETFMGGAVKNWDCGLEEESTAQKAQLKKLRFKYVTKMLLSDINQRKEWVMKEVKAFGELPQDKLKQIQENAEKIKEERLSSIV